MRMALVDLESLMKWANKNNCAVGSFSVANMETIIGIIKAAEEMNTPIILQIAEARLPLAPLELIGPMMLAAAKHSTIKVGVHLDHGNSISVIKKALSMGFTSVMYDGSHLPYEENKTCTLSVIETAKRMGASVEAELGTLGKGEDGSITGDVKYTEPAIAAEFAKVGMDALAVSIGNAHGNYFKDPKLKYDILKEISTSTQVPLVLHGGSGISPEEFRNCIKYGIRKINIATATFNAVVKGAQNYLSTSLEANYFDLNKSMVEQVYNNTKYHIRIFNNKEEV